MNPLRMNESKKIKDKNQTPAVIDLELEIAEELDLQFNEGDNLNLGFGAIGNLGASSDYQTLVNKPKINGTTLVNNYDEIDPTVPDWAKEENKPTYTAEEVGAVDENSEMTRVDIRNIWNKYF